MTADLFPRSHVCEESVTSRWQNAGALRERSEKNPPDCREFRETSSLIRVFSTLPASIVVNASAQRLALPLQFYAGACQTPKLL